MIKKSTSVKAAAFSANPQLSEARFDIDLTCTEFSITSGERRVPAIWWSRRNVARPAPLVLLGHGGSGHKRDSAMSEVAERLVTRLGLVVAAIDGPVHGARRQDLGMDPDRVKNDFRQMWAHDNEIDQMLEDWRAVLDALVMHPQIDAQRIGWYGLSMGTAYGLPLCAQEPRIRAAVLGLWGIDYPNNDRVVRDAAQVRCPVLFQQKWDDELFGRESQLKLFDRLGTSDKRLHVYPGRHGARTAEQIDDVEYFFERKLSQT